MSKSPLKIKKTLLAFVLAIVLIFTMAMPLTAFADNANMAGGEWYDLSTYTTAGAFNSGTVSPGTPYAGVRELDITLDGEPITVTHYYGWTYENPVNQKQRFNIYVPSNATADSAILNTVNNSGWNANNYPNTLNAASYTTTGNNPSNTALALKRGMIIISCGAVSRNDAATGGEYLGHSPGTIADTKAALRLPRANMGYDKAIKVGNPELVFVTGTSGGGALSTVLAASGDSPDYFPYLYELGAVGVGFDGTNYYSTVSDAYAGTIAYCPIADLPMADQAYEFTYNTSRTLRASNANVNGSMAPYANNTVMQWSNWLANDFVGYIDMLKLKDENGSLLTASYAPPVGDALHGTTGGTFKAAMQSLLESGLEKAIDEYANGNATGYSNADAVNTLGSRSAYININGTPAESTSYANGSVVDITNFDQYLTNLPTSALKVAGAFMSYGSSSANQWENDLLGAKDERYSYIYSYAWDNATSAAPATVGKANTGLDYSDWIKTATGKLVATQAKMTSPMPYLTSAAQTPYLVESGAVTSDVANVAPYWYVRHGQADRDTSFAIGTMLNYALLNNAAVENDFLNFNFSWAKGHSGSYDNPEAFAWLDSVLADYKAKNPAVVTAGASGAAQVYEGNPVSFDIWLNTGDEELANANGVSITFTVNDMLKFSEETVLLPGFSVITSSDWKPVGSGYGWQKTYELGKTGEGMDLDAKYNLLNVVFNPDGLGDGILTVDEVIIWTQPDKNAADVKVYPEIPVSSFITAVVETPAPIEKYSEYDLNKDEVIDFSDVVIALRAIGATNDDTGWDIDRIATDVLDGAITAALCDVNVDGIVDLLDISDIVAHYGAAPVQLIPVI